MAGLLDNTDWERLERIFLRLGTVTPEDQKWLAQIWRPLVLIMSTHLRANDPSFAHDAAEALQEFTVKWLTNLESIRENYRPGASFRAYFNTCVFHAAIDWIREKRRRSEVPIDTCEGRLTASDPVPGIIAKLDLRTLIDAPEDLMIAALRCEKQSFKEIAAQVNAQRRRDADRSGKLSKRDAICANAVCVRYHRALRKAAAVAVGVSQ